MYHSCVACGTMNILVHFFMYSFVWTECNATPPYQNQHRQSSTSSYLFSSSYDRFNRDIHFLYGCLHMHLVYKMLCVPFLQPRKMKERERQQSKSMGSFNKGYLFYDSLYLTLPHPIFYSNSLLRQPGY